MKIENEIGIRRLLGALALCISLALGALTASAAEEQETSDQRAKAVQAGKQLDDSNKLVVKAALESLGQIRGPTARDHLHDYLKNCKNAEWARYGLRALGWSGNAGSVDFLCGKYGVRNKNVLIAEAACESLATIGDKRAVPTLFEAIRSKKVVVARAAIKAVVRLDPAADGMSKLMVKLAKRKESQVREAVASALGSLKKSEETIAALVTLADKDGNSLVRLAACNSLGSIGATAAKPTLEKVAEKDKNQEVRAAAMKAIQRLPEQEVDQ